MSDKYFVLDTNVLIHNPAAINSFSDNTVIIPLTVIEELDRLKVGSDKKAMHAREVLRELDDLVKKKEALQKGAKLPSGGKLKIVYQQSKESSLPAELDYTAHDNKILSVAKELQNEGHNVFFISKDVNARIKAEAVGLRSQDYEKQKVSYESLYRGWREIFLKPEAIQELYSKKEIEIKGYNFNPNECVCMKTEGDDNVSALGRFNEKLGKVLPITEHFEAMGIKPLNLEQQFAFDLLLDDNVKLVTLIGQAGTGKTLIALAAGLQRVIGRKPRYEKLLVARPIVPLGRDIGYLPGSKDQKLNFWMQPIFDNLQFILRDKAKNKENDHGDANNGNGNGRPDKIDYLIEKGFIEIEAITYIRGRSIPNQFIIIDEAQNLTPHEIKAIISRAGEGTKIVLTGDAEQIDNPYLDANSNGLSYTADRMKNQVVSGQMFLSKSERSELASIAANIL
jgi:PhoH-like ATPase